MISFQYNTTTIVHDVTMMESRGVLPALAQSISLQVATVTIILPIISANYYYYYYYYYYYLFGVVFHNLVYIILYFIVHTPWYSYMGCIYDRVLKSVYYKNGLINQSNLFFLFLSLFLSLLQNYFKYTLQNDLHVHTFKIN